MAQRDRNALKIYCCPSVVKAFCLSAAMAMALVGCSYLHTPARPYTMGLGPNAFARVAKVDAFFSGPVSLTQFTVKGGGYDFKLTTPKAQAAMDLILQQDNMSEPEGPVHVWVKGIEEVKGRIVMKNVDFGFDPQLGRNNGRTGMHVEELNKLRNLVSQPIVDQRLAPIASLLVAGFDEHTTVIHSIEVDLPGGIQRRFDDAANMLRLLGDLAGIQTKRSATGSKAQDVAIKISYDLSGKRATLNEKFGLNESVVQADGMEVSLRALVDAPPNRRTPLSPFP